MKYKGLEIYGRKSMTLLNLVPLLGTAFCDYLSQISVTKKKKCKTKTDADDAQTHTNFLKLLQTPQEKKILESTAKTVYGLLKLIG